MLVFICSAHCCWKGSLVHIQIDRDFTLGTWLMTITCSWIIHKNLWHVIVTEKVPRLILSPPLSPKFNTESHSNSPCFFRSTSQSQFSPNCPYSLGHGSRDDSTTFHDCFNLRVMRIGSRRWSGPSTPYFFHGFCTLPAQSRFLNFRSGPYPIEFWSRTLTRSCKTS